MKIGGAIFGIMLAGLAAAQAPLSSEPRLAIFGRAVNYLTSQPLRRVAIKVYNAKDQWDSLTDSDGRFEFRDIPPGDYLVLAHRDGYADRLYRPVKVGPEAPKEMVLELRPAGVIAGKVVDVAGLPLLEARVEALGSRVREGRIEVIASVTTNDLGEYRLSSLHAGNYQVRATYRDGRGGDFDPTPLTTAAANYGGAEQPTQVEVKEGAVVSGIDFVLDPVRPATLQGTIHSEAGPFNERVTLWISGLAGEGGHSGSGEAGRFEIADVSPGSYIVSAETTKELGLYGATKVDVRGEGVTAIDIVLHPVPKLEGEIFIEGDTNVPAPPSILLLRTDHQAPLGIKSAQPGADHKFSLALIPGEYTLTFGAPLTNLAVRKVTLDDKPVVNWKLRIEASPDPKKLLILLGPKTQP